MDWKPDTLTEEEHRHRALETQLSALRSKHETLGAAYRDACAELERLRRENENYRARLYAIRLMVPSE